jgi:hypothetical protein
MRMPSLLSLKTFYCALCSHTDALFNSTNLLPVTTNIGEEESDDVLLSRWNHRKSFSPLSACAIVTSSTSLPEVTSHSLSSSGATSSPAAGGEDSIVLKEDIYLLLVLISALESYLLLQSSLSSPSSSSFSSGLDAIPSILTSWSERKDAEVDDKIFYFTETLSLGQFLLPLSTTPP